MEKWLTCDKIPADGHKQAWSKHKNVPSNWKYNGRKDIFLPFVRIHPWTHVMANTKLLMTQALSHIFPLSKPWWFKLDTGPSTFLVAQGSTQEKSAVNRRVDFSYSKQYDTQRTAKSTFSRNALPSEHSNAKWHDGDTTPSVDLGATSIQGEFSVSYKSFDWIVNIIIYL